jgi:hypothetical protein
VERFDKEELQRIKRDQENESDGGQMEDSAIVASGVDTGSLKRTFAAVDEEVEEEEVTDEYEEVDESDEDNSVKRQKTSDPDQPVEFNEDDIAWQLAAMGEAGGGEEYDEFAEAEGLRKSRVFAEDGSLTEKDSKGLFKDMLDDYLINPYSTWEKVIEEGKVVEDDRYKVLPNMRSRREVWDEWSREKIRKLKEEKAIAEKKDVCSLRSHSVYLIRPSFSRSFG